MNTVLKYTYLSLKASIFLSGVMLKMSPLRSGKGKISHCPKHYSTIM